IRKPRSIWARSSCAPAVSSGASSGSWPTPRSPSARRRPWADRRPEPYRVCIQAAASAVSAPRAHAMGVTGGAVMTLQTNPTLSNGRLISSRVTDKITASIEKGTLPRVNGIVVHQTGGATAQSALANYNRGAEGAHFLIDKDGTIYQTARV